MRFLNKPTREWVDFFVIEAELIGMKNVGLRLKNVKLRLLSEVLADI